MFERLKDFFRKKDTSPKDIPNKSQPSEYYLKITRAKKLIETDVRNAWHVDLLTNRLLLSPSDEIALQEIGSKRSRAVEDNNRFFEKTISERVKLIYDLEVPLLLRNRLDKPVEIETQLYLCGKRSNSSYAFQIERDGEILNYIFDQNNISDLQN